MGGRPIAGFPERERVTEPGALNGSEPMRVTSLMDRTNRRH